jgi:phospholipase C
MMDDAMGSEAALERLQKINHIVVLMMENRSFDHMLGYLKEAGLPDVEGLSPDMSNPDDQGVEQKVFRWRDEDTAFHPADDATSAPLDPKILDPCHGPGCVEEQLAGGNRGFVTNFLKSRPTKDRDGNPIQLPRRYRNFPMGYYTGERLPVYDHLARQFCVCDRWHASVPGDTWLNRCYAMAGSTSEPVGHKIGLLERLKRRAIIGKLRQLPIFDVEAFTRHLNKQRWRWYSHDPATLRAGDSQYRKAWHLSKDNFAYFDRRRVSFVTEAAESLITAHDSFLDDAATGGGNGVGLASCGGCPGTGNAWPGGGAPGGWDPLIIGIHPVPEREPPLSISPFGGGSSGHASTSRRRVGILVYVARPYPRPYSLSRRC